MTATDELRRLLDESGVEWHQDERQGWYFTEWDGRYGRCNAMEWHPTLTVMMPNLTPEQAIEATLGRTCEDVEADPDWFSCSKCGCTCNVDYWCDGLGEPNYCPNCGAKVLEPSSNLLGREEEE